MSDDTQAPPPRAATTSHIPPSGNRATRPTTRPSTPPPNRANGSVPTQKQAVLDIIDLAKMPLATIAAYQSLREPEKISPYLLDMYAIDNSKDAIADAVVKFAADNPVISVILDKVGKVSPIAEIMAVGIGLFMQISENHKKLPEGIAEHMPGVVPREELAMMVMEDVARMAT